MRKRLWLGLLFSVGCTTYRPLERQGWVLAWTDEIVEMKMDRGRPYEVVKPAIGAREEVIPQERFEHEVEDGRRPKLSASPSIPPLLVTDALGNFEMVVGQPRELVLDETQSPQPLISGTAVRAYWTRVRASRYKNSKASESSLFLVGEETGKSKLKFERKNKKPVIVTISVREAKSPD
jgi:hypothetical protein